MILKGENYITSFYQIQVSNVIKKNTKLNPMLIDNLTYIVIFGDAQI